MKKAFIYLIITSFFLISCSNKEVFKEKTKLKEHKTISLNVYDFMLVIDSQSFSMPDYLGFETNFLIEQLTEWGNKKFKVSGERNSLSLIIRKFSLEQKNIKKYKGLKKIFYSEERVEYDLNLELSLKFIDVKTTTNTLNLSGSISFIIDDSHSISQKRKFLLDSYNELINKIDKRLEYELDKEIFSKFRTTL